MIALNDLTVSNDLDSQRHERHCWCRRIPPSVTAFIRTGNFRQWLQAALLERYQGHQASTTGYLHRHYVEGLQANSYAD